MLAPTEVQVIPSAMLMSGLTQLLAVGGPFHTPTLQLYQNNVTITRLSVYADFTIANFSGYADIAAVTFEGPYLDVDGTALMLGSDNLFLATTASPFVSNLIFGYLLANAGLTALMIAYAFPGGSVGIAKPGDACPVAPFIRYSGN